MSDERGTAERMAEFRSPLFAPLDKTPPLKFDPLHDHILMRKQPHEERSAGGLFLPAPAPNSAEQNTVSSPAFFKCAMCRYAASFG